MSKLVRFADASVLVPSTVRILHTSKAVIVSFITHGQINLLDPVVRRDVQGFPLLTNLHHLNGFILSDLKDIQQFRLGLAVPHKLHDFVDSAGICANVEHCVLLIQ